MAWPVCQPESGSEAEVIPGYIETSSAHCRGCSRDLTASLGFPISFSTQRNGAFFLEKQLTPELGRRPEETQTCELENEETP